MTALLCIIAPFSIPLPVSPVPISLTNFIIFIIVYVLGTKDAVTCVIIYLILGAAGLPVFLFFQRRAWKTGRTNRGLSYRIYISHPDPGLSDRKIPENNIAAIAGMILGMAVCYAFGTAWLAWQMNQNFFAALAIGVLPYLPGDATKIIIAAVAGPKLRAAVRKQKLIE